MTLALMLAEGPYISDRYLVKAGLPADVKPTVIAVGSESLFAARTRWQWTVGTMIYSIEIIEFRADRNHFKPDQQYLAEVRDNMASALGTTATARRSLRVGSYPALRFSIPQSGGISVRHQLLLANPIVIDTTVIGSETVVKGVDAQKFMDSVSVDSPVIKGGVIRINPSQPPQ